MRLRLLAIPPLLAAAAAAAALLALPADGAALSSATGAPAPRQGRTAQPAVAAAGSVAGFTVSAIAYALDPVNAAQLAGITFRVAPAPGSGAIRVRLAPGGPWYRCSATAAAVRCVTPSATVGGLRRLEVVATG